MKHVKFVYFDAAYHGDKDDAEQDGNHHHHRRREHGSG
jgi:hypothetical protein